MVSYTIERRRNGEFRSTTEIYTQFANFSRLQSRTTAQQGQRTEPVSIEIWFTASQWSRVIKMENFQRAYKM